MKFLFVLHDPPYGTERTYNGIRWARQLLATPGTQPDTPADTATDGPADSAGNEVKVFLFGDAVVSVMDGQTVPGGFYNIGKMVGSLAAKGGVVGSCGACLDARGIAQEQVLQGPLRSSMDELAEWTLWADKVINV